MAMVVIELLPYAESGRTSCSFRIPFGTVSVREQYLENAVYLLYAHPYAPGEEIHDTAYHEAQDWDVNEYGIPRYRPGPGQGDLSHMNTMELPLITIDTENIYSSAVGDTLPQ